MSFEKLMSDLQELHGAQETLSKALPADDGKDEENVQAAAAEGGSDENGAAAGAGAEQVADETVAKALTVTLADGSTAEAIDGTEMIKSLQARLEKGETDSVAAITAAMEIIRGQGAMIKSLGETVAKLGNQGAGRKAVLTIAAKPSPTEGLMSKALEQPAGISHDEFFAKAMTAQKAGRISGFDISVAESHLNRGEPIPPRIVSAVMS